MVGDEVGQIPADSPATDSGNRTVTYSLKGDEISSILHQISVNTSDSISLSDGQMKIYESMPVMSFYTIGNRYQIYSGVPPEQAVTTVIYINDTDDSVISRTDSTSVEGSSAKPEF